LLARNDANSIWRHPRRKLRALVTRITAIVSARDHHGDLRGKVAVASVPSHVAPVPRLVNAGPTPMPARGARSRWLRRGIVAAVVLALVAGGIFWRARLQQSVKYETVPVEWGDVQAKVTATGNLNAVVDVLVSSQVSGNIKALYADWNSRVKKGQLVALIDPEVFQAQVDQATAASRSAHSSTLTAQAQAAKARAEVSAAEANERNTRAIAAKDRANEVNATL